MPLASKIVTLPWALTEGLLRGIGKSFGALPKGNVAALKSPWEVAESAAHFAARHPVLTGGTIWAASDALDRAKDLELSIRSNRMGLPYAKFSSCSDLDTYEQKKEYLSEKVAFEKNAVSNLLISALNPFAEGALGGLGSGLGKGLAEAGFTQIGKMMGGTASAIKERLFLNRKREDIVDNIRTNDPIVSVFEQESPGSTLKAYSTMVRIAPTLSLDHNVATSFLRNTAQTGGTMDFATVKLLADAESAVAKARHPEHSWQLKE